jgi:hypothetical protein
MLFVDVDIKQIFLKENFILIEEEGAKKRNRVSYDK